MSACPNLVTIRSRRARLLAGCALAAAFGSPAAAQTAFQATITQSQGVQGPVVTESGIPGVPGLRDTVLINQRQAIIDWTPNENGAGTAPITILTQGNQLRFTPDFELTEGGTYTVLNRINRSDTNRAILFDGSVRGEVGYGSTAPGGNIWFYSPGGIIAGANATFDVGSLILTANQINTTGGLFAEGDQVQIGTVRFDADPASRAAVIVQSGAKIDAVSSYVALVAPQVQQAGEIKVNGSAALVAGNKVDIRIPVAGGLFDITVFDAPDADGTTGSILQHSGTTTFTEAAGGEQRRIYMVAVPKNDAVTLLVSGTLGYQSATAANFSNGEIVLTSGAGVDLDDVLRTGIDTGVTSIAGGTFNANVRAFGGKLMALESSVAAADFAGDVRLTSDLGRIAVTAQSGRAINVTGNLDLVANLQSNLGSISVEAESGGALSVANLNIDADQVGSFAFGSTPAGAGVGTPVSMIADGGIITAQGDISIDASARGGSGGSGAGAAGFGGTVDIAARNGGQILAAADFSIASGATGGDTGYGAIAGSATAGKITIDLDAASKLSAGLIQLSASADGGNASSGTAGDATGGAITLTAAGGTLTFDTLDARANALAGNGPTGSINGGEGGQVTVSLTGTTATGANVVVLEALGQGTEGNVGSSGRGGTVSFAVAGSSFVSSGDIELLAQGVGDFGNVGGGEGIGGTIALTADNATIQAANITGDASGSGQQAFSSGSAGSGTGGTITLTSRAGGLIKGGSQFNANGIGSDGSGSATAGFGLGGTINLLAEGGSFDSTGGTLRLSANGTGGNAGGLPIFARGGTLLAQGGTIGIDVSAGGQLLLSALEAQANAGFDDQPDGIVFANHGGNAVGGTARLSISSGSVTADTIDLFADGAGAVSPAGGVGGNGYQGRAEVSVSGGTLTTLALNLGALAFGGPGYVQDSESNEDAGAGGEANTLPSPFAGQPGAIVTVTGGLLDADSVSLDARGRGGNGGDAEFFAAVPAPREGGIGEGGVAIFSVGGTGSVDILTLDVDARGIGGAGGSLFIGEGSSSNTIGGDGGAGLGGLVSLTFAGSGDISLLNLAGSAVGEGGGGGSVETGYGGLSGSGSGGRGGNGSGGGIDVLVSGALADGTDISIDASAVGGDGGAGPSGGSGGGALGGDATIELASGINRLGLLQAFSFAQGGDGADGLGGVGGSGGSATARNATLTISGSANVTSELLQLQANGQGGAGGAGRSAFSAGFQGGDGGGASGGTAAINVNGGSLTLLEMVEGSPAQITAVAIGGGGGSGGNAVEGPAGSGGTGGSAVGGSALFSASDAAVDLFATTMLTGAAGGEGGFAGSGSQAGPIDGGFGDAEGGSIAIAIDQSGTPSQQVRLGSGELSADFAEIDAGIAGDISIVVTGRSPVGGLAFTSLAASARGLQPSASTPHGISVQGRDATVKIDGTATLDATGSINVDFAGDGGLAAGDLFITSGGNVLGRHLGRSGATSSLDSANTININAAGGISFTDEALLVATSDVNLNANGGAAAVSGIVSGSEVTINATEDLKLGRLAASAAFLTAGIDGSSARDLSVDGLVNVGGTFNLSATGDVLVSSGADVNVGGSLFIGAGDDIIIGSGAIVRGTSGELPETGYGGPLSFIRAGSLLREEAAPGDISSLIVDGSIEFGDRTLIVDADAIGGSTNSSVRAGNLYINLNNVPPNEVFPSSDLGQLASPCLQGAVCLSTVGVTGAIEIGGDIFNLPLYLRLTGDIDATSVVLRAQRMDLGQTGVISSIAASGSLLVEAVNGNLALAGPMTITGGSSLARVAASNNISGAADVSAPATLELYAGNNLSLGAVQADLIRTVDFAGAILNANGVSAIGVVDVGKVSYAKSISLTGGAGVSLGAADLGANRLDLFTTTGLARLGGGSAGDVIVSGDRIDIEVAASGKVVGTATVGTATLGTVSGTSIDIKAVTGIDFFSLSTPGALSLTSVAGTLLGGNGTGGTVFASTSGQISATSLTATAGDLTLDADAGISLASLSSSGTASLIADSGVLTVSGDAGATEGITAVARSVSLRGINGLNVSSATAFAGDLILTATAGALAAGTSSASGAATLTGGGGIAFTQIKAGSTLALDAQGAITGGSLQGAGITATGKGGISLASLSSSGAATLTASAGKIDVKDVLVASGGLSATGTAVSLRGSNGLTVNNVTATAGEIQLAAGADSLSVQSAGATGQVTLLAENGTVEATDITGASAIRARGRSVSLGSESGSLKVTEATATAGDIVLSALGDISFGAASATGELRIASGGAVDGNDPSAAAVRVSGKSVDISGSEGLNIAEASATDGDVALTATGGELKIGSADATGNIKLAGSGAASFSSLRAGQALTLTSGGDVAAGDATAGSIFITTPGALSGEDFLATTGALTVIATKGVSLDTASTPGVATLKADQGTVLIASDIRPGEGLVVAAPTINLTGQTGLNIVEATATSGDLTLKTISGDLIAGKSSAAGAIALESAGALTFASLTAQQGVTLKATGDMIGGSVTGTALTATAGGAMRIDELSNGGAVQATARSLALGAAANLQLSKGTATDGDLVLTAGANLALGQATASKALTATAGGTISVNGSVQGASIGLTSADISLASGAQVGSVTQTGSLTLTSTAARSFIGGTGAGSGYNLDASELTRIFARDGITITAPSTASSAAFALVEPGSASMVLDSLTFSGAQLGSAGAFTVDSPRSIGIVGNVQYKNFASGQSVIYQAGSDISLGAETGLVALRDSGGALAGTLRLQAPRVTAMSVPARAEIPNLTLDQAQQRLGTNDAVQNDGGYFQAGNIVVRIGQFLFIQNSGAGSDADQRRGFTANSATFEVIGPGAAQVVVNGAVGGAVGQGLASATTLIGTFDPASSFSGCALGSSSCGGAPAEVTNRVFSVSRDQIRDEQEEDEAEEALQASQSRPDPIIQIMTAPSSRFDPLIDEPITGAGNEDLWETPTVPSPGQ